MQYRPSKNISLGLLVESEITHGHGSFGHTIVRYSDGSIWVFDRDSALQVGTSRAPERSRVTLRVEETLALNVC